MAYIFRKKIVRFIHLAIFCQKKTTKIRNRKLFFFVLTGYDSLFDFPIEEEEDDPDILEDPIYDMDIQVST